MNKREFLASTAAAAVGATGQATVAHETAGALQGPGLLTVAGAVPRANRGPLDPVRDQLMIKHGAAFERAWVADAEMLGRLRATVISPTLEYDAKPHRLGGPLLTTVLEQAGVGPGAAATLLLRAIDGYTVTRTLADARADGLMIATSLDGVPLSLGGLGPLWAVHDADRLPALRDKPLSARFADCPWALYFIDVQPA